MLNWKQMPYFIAVARSGSLRAAADELNATHATVRNHIETLEAGLGVQLFRRSKSGLELTSAGQTLLPDALDAEKLLVKAGDGVRGLDRQASGLIRISLDPMLGHFLMAPIFAEFCKIYPDVELEVRLTYEIEDINRLETDVSIRNAAEISDDVVARKLFPTDSAVYASREYVDTHLAKAGSKGEGLSWIGYGDVPEQQVWIDQSPFPKGEIRHRVADPEMHLHLVRAGGGMTFLPVWFEELFPELRRMSHADFTNNRFTWILLHEDLRRVARIRFFVDYLANALLDVRAQLRKRIIR